MAGYCCLMTEKASGHYQVVAALAHVAAVVVGAAADCDAFPSADPAASSAPLCVCAQRNQLTESQVVQQTDSCRLDPHLIDAFQLRAA